MINPTLAALKLASNFCNQKDVRAYATHVNVVSTPEINLIQATNGHIAIRIHKLAEPTELPTAITLDSIRQACKVDRLSLLDSSKEDIRFPPLDKIFDCLETIKREQVQAANFDAKYISLIFRAIETYRKDLGIKYAPVKFEPLVSDGINYISLVFNWGLPSEINIAIAIMPVKD